MQADYIRKPQVYIQQDLFSSNDTIYSSLSSDLFFDTLIRWQFSEDIIYLVSKDMSYLLVSGYGVKISKKSERLVIKDSGKFVFELPFFKVRSIAVMSKGVALSSDLIEQFCRNDINLSFHDFGGKPYALMQPLSAPFIGNIKRLQILAQNSLRGLKIASQIARGKIINQQAVLKYFVKNLKPDTPQSFSKIQSVKNACAKMQVFCEKILQTASGETREDFEKSRSSVMGYEGTAARVYWQSVSEILSDKVAFSGRESKIPKDAVNTLLNYGYGILYSKIWNALILAGLDPYLGFLHSEQSGKPSLVFDMIEEFRAPVVDRTVIAYIALNRSVKIEQGLLSIETRQAFSEKILDRLTSSEYYEGKKIMLSDIILSQARKFTAHLESRSEEYEAYSFKW
ncbi:MAG: CRISPR-associated endonuclease Cas1 [Endomicrobia bacterium]|nr:CRISPR-associated endonuclease Cas1 [Endomicrobiia bacterium]MCL2506284.1 CRISPR-associated endonuclease Cas1 [Endomicrobiia bacterium]